MWPEDEMRKWEIIFSRALGRDAERNGQRRNLSLSDVTETS